MIENFTPNPRPYKTYYCYDKNNKVTEWARIGHAKTRTNAIRAAIVKAVEGMYASVDIYNEEGVRCGRIIRQSAHKIFISI
jgi:hypothetical protein